LRILSENRAFTFALRGAEGRVEITYSVNEDPARWGFHLLGSDFNDNSGRGFPVIQARVRFSAEGYAGCLGWIQIVDYTVRNESGEDEQGWAVPDVPPQARDANTPYMSFGIEPTLFDAPAFNDRNVDFNARSFLTYTPDCLMSPIVEPLIGFCWGVEVIDSVVSPKALRPASISDWTQARKYLGFRLPTWKFNGREWNPPSFDQ
jgi:hypothetical protein